MKKEIAEQVAFYIEQLYSLKHDMLEKDVELELHRNGPVDLASFAIFSVSLKETIKEATKFANEIRFSKTLKKMLLDRINDAESWYDDCVTRYKKHPAYTYDTIQKSVILTYICNAEKDFIKSLYE